MSSSVVVDKIRVSGVDADSARKTVLDTVQVLIRQDPVYSASARARPSHIGPLVV